VTKSLSNVIKAYAVRYDGQEIMTIEPKFRQPRKEIAPQRVSKEQEGFDSGEFVEGIKAVMVEQMETPEEQEKMANSLLENARNEAQKIIENAKQEAAQLRDQTYQEAQKQGFEAGIKEANQERKRLEEEYKRKVGQLEKEYDTMIRDLEPKMVNLMAALIEKITGILVEDKEEVILYLVEKALRNMDRCDEYLIKVSKEDYDTISSKKNLLLDAIGKEVGLEIIEDSNLTKNQCFIETDTKVINCSLDVQLNNLITDLKILAGI